MRCWWCGHHRKLSRSDPGCSRLFIPATSAGAEPAGTELCHRSGNPVSATAPTTPVPKAATRSLAQPGVHTLPDLGKPSAAGNGCAGVTPKVLGSHRPPGLPGKVRAAILILISTWLARSRAAVSLVDGRAGEVPDSLCRQLCRERRAEPRGAFSLPPPSPRRGNCCSVTDRALRQLLSVIPGTSLITNYVK